MISSFAYKDEKLYLVFFVFDYNNMADSIGLKKMKGVRKMAYLYCCAELSTLNNKLQLERIKILSGEDFMSDQLSLRISVQNNHPVVITGQNKDRTIYKALRMDSAFALTEIRQTHPELLNKMPTANWIHNQFAIFRYSNVLIDNQLNQNIALSPYTSDSLYLCDFVQKKGKVYALMSAYRKYGHTFYVFEVDIPRQEIKNMMKFRAVEIVTLDGLLFLDGDRIRVIGMKDGQFIELK